MPSKYPFLDNWFSTDYEIRAFEEHIDLYLQYFDTQMRSIVLKLLDKYEFISREKMDILVKEYEEAIDKYISSNKLEKCLTTSIIIDDEAHNSFGLFSYFKYQRNFKYKNPDEELNEYKDIVLVDDYSGTGTSYYKYFTAKSGLFAADTKLYFFPLFMTDISETFIATNDNDVFKKSIFDFSITKKREAKYLEPGKLLNKNELEYFDYYCKEIFKINELIIHGKDAVEDLITLPYGTPNGTIGMFWSTGELLYKPLFSRSGEQTLSMKAKKIVNYELLKKLSETIKKDTPSKMRKYIWIAIFKMMNFDEESIISYLNLSKSEFDSGLSYLDNTEIIKKDGSINIPIMNKYIDVYNAVYCFHSGSLPGLKKEDRININLFKAKYDITT